VLQKIPPKVIVLDLELELVRLEPVMVMLRQRTLCQAQSGKTWALDWRPL